MYFYTHSTQLSAEAIACLHATPSDTCLLLISDAVYISDKLSRDFPHLRILSHEQDCTIRGITIAAESSINDINWCNIANSHAPGVLIG